LPVLLDDLPTDPAVAVSGSGGKRLWRKHVLRYSEWRHPQDPSRKLTVTPTLVKQLVQNFRAGIRDLVAVPEFHTDDWKFNRGRVVELEEEPDGLYALMEVDEDLDKALAEGKALGCSALFDENYFDLETERNVGAVMRHVCVTNVPVIKKLRSYEPVLLSEGIPIESVTYLSEGGAPHMDLEQMLAELKSKHGIDVEALKAGAARAAVLDDIAKSLRDGGVALSEDAQPEAILPAITTALSERKTLMEGQSDTEKRILGLETALSEEREQRVATEKAAKRAAAEAIVKPYVSARKMADGTEVPPVIDPVHMEKFVMLAETDPEGTRSMLDAMKPRVEVTGEAGSTLVDDPDATAPPSASVRLSEEQAATEIERLTKAGRESGVLRA
jgi:hypothetical protein